MLDVGDNQITTIKISGGVLEQEFCSMIFVFEFVWIFLNFNVFLLCIHLIMSDRRGKAEMKRIGIAKSNKLSKACLG